MDEPVTAPHSVLIIDDDTALLTVLVKSLQSVTTMRVFSAENAVEGLDIVHREQINCVVVDVMLPYGSMDGYQFVKIIRGDPRTASLPLIFLSARSDDFNRYTGLAVGGDNYLVKPVPLKILIGAIEKAIATNPTERKLRLQRLAESDPPRATHD